MLEHRLQLPSVGGWPTEGVALPWSTQLIRLYRSWGYLGRSSPNCWRSEHACSLLSARASIASRTATSTRRCRRRKRFLALYEPRSYLLRLSPHYLRSDLASSPVSAKVVTACPTATTIRRRSGV